MKVETLVISQKYYTYPPMDEIINRGGWTVTDRQITPEGEIIWLLERPAALKALENLIQSLEGACSTQFRKVYKDGERPDECPYCGNPNTGDMEHEYKCPYGTLIRLLDKARNAFEKLVYGHEN